MEEFMSYSIKKSLFAALFFMPFLFLETAQAQTITGQILDVQSKEPMAGAAIRQAGTSRGAVSQTDGTFQLQLSQSGEEALIITYLGYKDQRIDVSDKKTDLRIFLYPQTFISDDIFVQALRVDDAT